MRRSSKKMLMSKKSLLLEMDISGATTAEKDISSISNMTVIPTYEEVHKRKTIVDNKKEETKKKVARGRKCKSSSSHPRSPTSGKNKKVAAMEPAVVYQTSEDSSLPPLVVERKTTSSNLGSSTTFLSSTLVSSKKFFKTKFKESLESSIASWRSGGVFSGNKKRKTYKSAKVGGAGVSSKNTSVFSSECQDDDPYSSLNISPAIVKTQKSQPRRKTLPPQTFQIKTYPTNKLDENEDITAGEDFDPDGQYQDTSGPSNSRLHASNTIQKGVVSNRKPSMVSQEVMSSSPPPLVVQSPMHNNLKENQENRGKVDNNLEEMRTVLAATLRVLEMLSRGGKDDPTLRGIWGDIRRIAEREENR